MNKLSRHPQSSPTAIPLCGLAAIRGVKMTTPSNGYYVLIKRFDNDEIVKIVGPLRSIWKTDKVEDGMAINLHEDFYTYGAWFGPDVEPIEKAA